MMRAPNSFKRLDFSGCPLTTKLGGLKMTDAKVATLDDVVTYCRGSMSAAARLLGVQRGTIGKYLKNRLPNVVLVVEIDGQFVYKWLK